MLRSKIADGLKHLTVFTLIAVLLVACGGKNAAKGDTVVATYLTNANATEEHKITLTEFEAFVGINKLLNPMFAYYEQDPSFREEMLKQLVSFHVFANRLEGDKRSEAEKVAKEDYEAFLAALEEGMGGAKEMDKQLKELNITKNDIKSYIDMYSFATEHLMSTITDERAKEEFDTSVKEDPNAFVTIGTVSHILIGTVDPQTQEEKRTNEEALAIAEEVRTKLIDGADFAEMVSTYSDDEGSIESGGAYKDFNLYQFVEEFRDAALTLPLHEISEPVETMYGYHIIRVDDRKVPTFEEVKEQIITQIMQEVFAEFMEEELPTLIKSTNLPEVETTE